MAETVRRNLAAVRYRGANDGGKCREENCLKGNETED
jgi:hypothetical protein